MASDPTSDTDTTVAAPAAKSTGPRDKVRLRFRKAGDLSLVSHHDLMHVCERMFRRAALPIHQTQGFHPKPRMVFALALGLGIVGAEEVLELELDAVLDEDTIRARLAQQCPPGLTILQVRRIPTACTGQVRRVCYRFALPPARQAEAAERMTALLGAAACMIDRVKPQPRRFDLRPFVRGLSLHDGLLEMDLWVTPHGAARPDEVLVQLGLDDVLAMGGVLERSQVILHDECAETDTPPATLPHPRGQHTPARLGSQAPVPLLPGPLSFDT